MEMNKRNWERLLIATLQKVRASLPGPGITEEHLKTMSDIEKIKATLGIDIDEIMIEADNRGIL